VTLDVTIAESETSSDNFCFSGGFAAHTSGMFTFSTTKSPSDYTPMLAASTWAQVKPFVLDTIATRCAAMSRRQIDEHQRVLAYFGDWVVQTGMVSLEDALRPDVIDVYAADRGQEVIPVMAERERKMLRTLAGIAPAVEKRTVTTVSEPERPYTDAELAVFRTWATNQRTDYQRIGCLAVFVLGVGCGLTAAEMLSARGADLRTLDDVLAVRVDRDERIVPVVDRWRPLMERLNEIAPSGLLIAPTARDRKGAMRSVLGSSVGEAKPTPARLRVTWLVAHLEAGTPLAALLPASGMTSTDSLRRAMSYVRPMSTEHSLAALRMTESPR